MTKRRIVILLVLCIMSLLCLSACNKHKHTFAERFTYDAENHWRQATCEHNEEKKELGAHKFSNGESICKTCGYQMVSLQIKTDGENPKYIRTQSISGMLRLGFQYGQNTADIKWVQAKDNHIESYTIADGQITITVCAVMQNIKYTQQITMPLEETPVDVETFFAKEAGEAGMLSGIVAGFSTSAGNNEVILADKQTGKLISVIKMGEGKLLYGGYSLPDIAIGDEVILPVTLVKEKQSATTANSARIYAEYTGGGEYQAAVVSKNNQIKYPAESILIDSQAALEAFLAEGNRENNHYKIVKFKGKMNFVMDGTYENYNFWFSEKQAKSRDDLKIDQIVPCFNDPAVFYTTGESFSKLVFGEAYHAANSYTNPDTAEVEITAVFLGGGTTFGQFLMLDASWVSR